MSVPALNASPPTAASAPTAASSPRVAESMQPAASRLHVVAFGLEDHARRRRYDDLFERCPDAVIQQSTWWAEVIADLGADRPVFLLCERAGEPVAGLPLYLYTGGLGTLVSSVPQAGPLGGIFVRPDLTAGGVEAVHARLLAEARRLAEDAGAIALTIVTNPFRDDVELYRRFLAPHYTLESFTQAIALGTTHGRDGLCMDGAKSRSALRRHRRRADAAGLTIAEQPTDEDFDRWYRLHGERHAALGARPLPRALLANVRRVLEPRGKAWFAVAKRGDEIASGVIVVGHRRIVDVFMISMNPRHRRLAPNWALTAATLRRAHDAGVATVNWQSSPSRDGGLYAFKRRWGSVERRYHFVTRLFVDVGVIRGWGRDALAEAFPGHFVVPFGALTDAATTCFRK